MSGRVNRETKLGWDLLIAVQNVDGHMIVVIRNISANSLVIFRFQNLLTAHSHQMLSPIARVGRIRSAFCFRSQERTVQPLSLIAKKNARNSFLADTSARKSVIMAIVDHVSKRFKSLVAAVE